MTLSHIRQNQEALPLSICRIETAIDQIIVGRSVAFVFDEQCRFEAIDRRVIMAPNSGTGGTVTVTH